MRRRPNRGTRRSTPKRRGTPPAAGTGRRRGRPPRVVEAATSGIEFDIRRVLRCAGDVVSVEEVMDVLARWLGSRPSESAGGAPPSRGGSPFASPFTPSFAVPSELRRRAAVAGAAVAGCRARLRSLWHRAPRAPQLGALA